MATFGLHISTKPIQHRIIFVESKDDIIKDILEAPGYKITNKCVIISYLGNKPYCLRTYKSKYGSDVVDLRINGKYKSFIMLWSRFIKWFFSTKSKKIG